MLISFLYASSNDTYTSTNLEEMRSLRERVSSLSLALFRFIPIRTASQVIFPFPTPTTNKNVLVLRSKTEKKESIWLRRRKNSENRRSVDGPFENLTNTKQRFKAKWSKRVKNKIMNYVKSGANIFGTRRKRLVVAFSPYPQSTYIHMYVCLHM